MNSHKDDSIVKIEFTLKKSVSRLEIEQVLFELFNKLNIPCDTDLSLNEYVIHVATQFVQRIKYNFTKTQSRPFF